MNDIVFLYHFHNRFAVVSLDFALNEYCLSQKRKLVKQLKRSQLEKVFFGIKFKKFVFRNEF